MVWFLLALCSLLLVARRSGRALWPSRAPVHFSRGRLAWCLTRVVFRLGNGLLASAKAGKTCNN